MGLTAYVKGYIAFLIHLFALLSVGLFFLMLVWGKFGLAPFYLILPAIVYGRYIWRGYRARQHRRETTQ